MDHYGQVHSKVELFLPEYARIVKVRWFIFIYGIIDSFSRIIKWKIIRFKPFWTPRCRRHGLTKLVLILLLYNVHFYICRKFYMRWSNTWVFSMDRTGYNPADIDRSRSHAGIRSINIRWIRIGTQPSWKIFYSIVLQKFSTNIKIKIIRPIPVLLSAESCLKYYAIDER